MPSSCFPVSCNQEWVLRKHDGGRPYADSQWPIAFHVRRPVDVSALEAALNGVIARHAGLRAAICGTAQTPCCDDLSAGPYRQRVLDAAEVRISQHAVPSLDAVDDDSALVEHAQQELMEPLDPRTPPPLRASLVTDRTGATALVVVLSHLAFDHWSVDVLQRDLGALYRSHRTGTTCGLPRLDFHAPHFALRERQCLRSGALEEAASYWARRWVDLSDAFVRRADLPFARPDAAAGGGAVRRAGLFLDPARSIRIRQVIKSRRLTGYVFFRAAVTIVLHHYTRMNRIAFWANFANRAHADAEHLIGWCANVHPVLTELAPELTFHDVCRQVATAIREVQRHETLSLPAMWLAMDGRPDLGDTTIIFDHWRAPRADRADADLEPLFLPVGHRWTDFQISVRDDEMSFEILVRFDSGKYQPEGVASALRDLDACIAHMTENIDARMSLGADLVAPGGS